MLKTPFRSTTFFAILAVIILVFGVFSPILKYEVLNYDDVAYTTNNAYVQEGFTKRSLNWFLTYGDHTLPTRPGVTNLWHPLTWISWTTDQTLSTSDSFPQQLHLTNLLLHALNVTLVLLLARSLSLSPIWSFIAAALFALHPSVVEPVAWISARKDLLSTPLALSSILFYVYYSKSNKKAFFITSLLLFLAALSAKPNVVVLPLLLIALDACLLKPKNFPKNPKKLLPALIDSAKGKVLYFLIAAVVAILAIFLQSKGTHGHFSDSWTIGLRFRLFSARIAEFARLLLGLKANTYHYALPTGTAFYILSVIGFLTVSGSLTLLSMSWKHKRHLAFAILWFGICLFPVSGLIHVGTSFVSDRYLYFPLSAAVIGGCLWLSSLQKQWLPFISIVAIAAGAFWCSLLLPNWKSDDALFKRGVVAQPNNAATLLNYGTLLLRKNQLSEAKPFFSKVITLFPKDHIAHSTMGSIYLQEGKIDEAKQHLEKSVQLNPKYPFSWHTLGKVHASQKNWEPAVKALEKVNEIYGWNRPEEALELAFYLLKSGNLKEAQKKATLVRDLENTPLRLQEDALKILNL